MQFFFITFLNFLRFVLFFGFVFFFGYFDFHWRKINLII